MKHLGDIQKIDGTKIPPVDVITFGAPCQDLSVAGKRAGMKHKDLGDEETTRSGLFYEAVRLIKEMRSVERRTADGSNSVERYPRFAIYENVPGALSSAGGEDWRLVLEYLASVAEEGVSIPLPPKGKWEHAGCIVGDGWSLAWRLMDGQYFGCPQRRKRVCCLLSLDEERVGRSDGSDNHEAVVDSGAVAGRAAEILFEREGGLGDLDEGFAPWKGIARDPAESVGEHPEDGHDYTLQVRCGNPNGGGKGALIQTDKTATLSASQQQTLFRESANDSKL